MPNRLFIARNEKAASLPSFPTRRAKAAFSPRQDVKSFSKRLWKRREFSRHTSKDTSVFRGCKRSQGCFPQPFREKAPPGSRPRWGFSFSGLETIMESTLAAIAAPSPGDPFANPHNEPQRQDARSRAQANSADTYSGKTLGSAPPRGLDSDSHRAKLSGIIEDIIAERGYATVKDSGTLEALGFPKSMNPALLIPWHSADGQRVEYQIRPDSPADLGARRKSISSRRAGKISLTCLRDVGKI